MLKRTKPRDNTEQADILGRKALPGSGIRPAGAAAQPAGVARSVGAAAGTDALRGEFRCMEQERGEETEP